MYDVYLWFHMPPGLASASRVAKCQMFYAYCIFLQTKFYPKKSARTWNQIRVISLSGCVTNSDASCQKSKIDFQPYFWNPQMLSFSYNTMGSKVNGLAVREHFLSKNALKRSILAAMTPERLASEKGMTQNFKGIINFYMSCGNFGAYTSK